MQHDIDLLTGLLMWALYHHQGGHSEVGKPIRAALGIGQFDSLTPEQVDRAKTAAEIALGEPHH